MTTPEPNTNVTIRLARPSDEPALRRLAQRDSSTVPAGRLLVAEQDGELRAAISLGRGEAVADPFHHTAATVRMLELRAGQLGAGRAGQRPAGGFRLRRRRAAALA